MSGGTGSCSGMGVGEDQWKGIVLLLSVSRVVHQVEV